MARGIVRALAVAVLLGGLSGQAQLASFKIAPLASFGSGGWLAPNGFNGSTYSFLTSADTERGLAFGNGHLYLVSRNGGDSIRILDPQTGAELGALNLGTGVVGGGTFNMNMVAVGSDGAIYVGNLAIGPAPFRLYRWSDDRASTTPTVVYNDVPLAGARLGDSLALIGRGVDTRLVAGFNNNPDVVGDNGYAVLDPSLGTASVVGFTDLTPGPGDFRLGISFLDPGHVLGTQGGAGGLLRYTSFIGNIGTLLASPLLASADERALSCAVVGGIPLLAALSTTDNHVSIYDLTDPVAPILVGQANATVGTLPTDARNTGSVAWGPVHANDATLYAMATSDGIQAFTVTVPDLQPPVIISQPQDQTVLELSPALFSAAACGVPAPAYQWYSGGKAIPGATDSSYSIFSATYLQNGAEFNVVARNTITNLTCTATSRIASLTVIRDTNAPTVSRLIPASGSTLAAFNELEVHFSKPVTGLRAEDLLINGNPATNVTPYAANIFVFAFPSPPQGAVQVAWSRDQVITDLTSSSNRFGGTDLYSYVVAPAVITNSVFITEFMAKNTKTIRDEDGQYSDWIELFNAGAQPVNLSGWFLTDEPAQLTKWQFPSEVTILPQAYLLVWASGLDRTNPASPLHTNFKLDHAAGSYLGLVYADGVTRVSSFWPYPAQYPDVSYGRDRLDPALLGYFTNATPGAPNATIGPGFGPEVQFSVASGTFRQPFALTLSTTDSAFDIRYVLVTNATAGLVTNTPTGGSPIYTAPLMINATTQVRARAFPRAGYLPGPVHNETYLQLGADAVYVSSDLPLVVFHNFGAGTDVPATDDQFITMQVFETRNGLSSLVNPPDVAVQGYFHRRGQATFWDPKPNLRVETQDAYGDHLDVELLGMPADNDWVFYGIDCFDKVLMHNPLAHELYRQMGHYSSRTRYVEVYIKLGAGAAGPITRADYYGLYVLEEKIKIAKNRVDIDELRPENTNLPSITGGYLLSIDKSNPGNPADLAGASVWYLNPDYYTITLPERAAQKQYIDGYFAAFDNALNGPNWTNPLSGYAAYIDLNSWIDYHLHQTFVFNVDMLRISAYFYKPRGGKIVQGPLWDFDRAFADSSDDRGFNPRLWRSSSGDGGTDVFNPNCSIFCNPWYGKLFTDPDFWQHWIDRYQELRKSTYSLTNVYAYIDLFANQVRKATSREYARWAGSGASDTSPRSGFYSGDGFSYTFPTPGSWQGEVNFTKNWFSNRLDFIDAQFLNPPAFSSSGGAITSGFPVILTAATREPNSTVYYTLDGTDPRLPGGAVSPRARSSQNSVLVTLTNNARIIARNWNSNHQNLTGPNNPPLNSCWSGPMAATFMLSPPQLAITEIMYDPPKPFSGTNGNDQYEFVELKNVGSAALNLVGIHFTNGIDFTFTATNAITNLGPGEYLVLVANLPAFQSRYPQVTNVAGQYAGHLNNSGDRIDLEGALRGPILDFRYDPSWYPTTAGNGFSLVIRNEYAPFFTWTNAGSWRASFAVGGSPGGPDTVPAEVPPILVNEALTHTDPPQQDSIELFNPTPGAVSLDGWFLTDDRSKPFKYCIPANSFIPAGGYLVFTESQFNNNGTNSFALSSLGDGAYLFSGNGTNLTGYRHGFEFGPQMNGVTFGRYVSSDGVEHFVTQERNSLGAPNIGPQVGPLVINEIMYAPPPFGLDADLVDEFIELRNISEMPVALFDPAHTTNAWRFGGAVQYTFPPDTMIPPWSFLLVVGFDPVHDPASLAWFRNRYRLDTNAIVLGPYEGHLGNQGESLALYQPDKPEIPPSPNAGFVPYVLVEEIHFSPLPPWPSGTDGTGRSLQRVASLSFGDDPANWRADTPSPAAINPVSLAVDSDQDGMPDESEFIAGTDPRNAQDRLRFERVWSDGINCVLEFTTRVGRTYIVERLDGLGVANTWVPLQPGLVGTGARVAASDPLTADSRFYRLKVVRD